MTVDFTRDDVLDRLAQAMEAPLTAPGSQVLALDVLKEFNESLPETWTKFGDKMLETLSDGERHDTLAITPDRTVALWFVVWPGSHLEVQAARIGVYFGQIARNISFLVEAGIPLEGFLELDVYVIDSRAAVSVAPDSGDLDVGVEYSFVPAHFFGGSKPSNPQWMTVMLNLDLLSQTEREAIGKSMA